MKEIKRLAKQIAKLQGDAYFSKQVELNDQLGALLIDTETLKKLSKANLYLFISLCSTHRPRAPHTILGYLSDLHRRFA